MRLCACIALQHAHKIVEYGSSSGLQIRSWIAKRVPNFFYDTIRTPNAAGFVYQDWALQGSKNCCFLKFDIKTPPGPDGEKPLDNSGLVPPSSGQTSVIYAKTGYPPESRYGFDLVGAYESSGNDIGQSNWVVGQTLDWCLWDCSQKSGCIGVVYRHDKGINNSPTCYFKSKIESAVQWTNGYSG